MACASSRTSPRPGGPPTRSPKASSGSPPPIRMRGSPSPRVTRKARFWRGNEPTAASPGTSPEGRVSLSIFDVTHPDDRDSDVDSFERQTAGARGRYAVEKRLIRKDGRIIWVAVTSSTVRDSAGRFLYGVRVMRDVTSGRHAQEALA